MLGRLTNTGIAVLLATVLGPLLVGCQPPAEPTMPTVARVTIESPEAYDALWAATDKTLRRYYLPPDRQDRADGIIVTRPETSAAWFELWRPQPQPAYAWWEANLHPIRRQATVKITPIAKPTYQVSVEVERSKYSLEPRQVDNPAAVLRLYGNTAPTTGGRMAKQAETSRWIPLGRDGWMESEILSHILDRYGSGEILAAPVTTQPAGSAG